MRLFGIGLAALCATQASVAAAQKITQPDWTHRPSGEAIGSAFPPLAMALGLPGYAILNCDVAATGALADCDVEMEAPEGLGFGRAAFSLADEFRMSPQIVNGKPVAGGTVRIPIRFTLPPAEPLPNLPSPTSQEALVEARRLASAGDARSFYVDERKREIERIEESAKDEADQPIGSAALAVMRSSQERLTQELLEGHAHLVAASLTAAELRSLIEDEGRVGPKAMAARHEALMAGLQPIRAGLVARSRQGAREIICAARDCGEVFSNHPMSPIWSEQPSDAERGRLAPKMALLLSISGHADLTCGATSYGALEHCKVIDESPRGFNFASAALGLTSRYRISPAANRGAKEPVSLTINFEIFDETAAESTPTPQPEAKVALGRKVAIKTKPEGEVKVGIDALFAELAEAKEAVDDPALVAETRAAISTAAARALPRLIEEDASFYAAAFSSEELQEIDAYLSNPARDKLIAAQLAAAPWWDDYAGGLYTKITSEAGREFCKEHDCTVPKTTPPPRER